MQLFRHCIIVASNYIGRKRKGLHYLFNDANIEFVLDVIKAYANNEGVSAYFINTESETIKSVVEKDKFFENINIIEGTNKNSVSEFNKAIANQITIFDIVLLLLTRRKMNYSDINTYLFFIYAEYYLKNRYTLFDEKISIVDRRPKFKCLDKYLKNGETNASKLFYCTKDEVLLSKFFNCEDGIELMNEILETFKQLLSVKKETLSCCVEKFIDAALSSMSTKDRKKQQSLTVLSIEKFYLSPFKDK